MKRILFLAVSVGLLLQGCGGREMLKTEVPASVASPTPVVNVGPQAPSLVDIRVPVSDEDYQKALPSLSAEANRHNLGDFLTVGQYQYDRGDLADSLRTFQKTLLASDASSGMDRAQYMVGQVYYDKKDYLPSLSAFQKVAEKYPQSTYATQALQMMEFILTYSLSLPELKSFTANYPDSPLNCSALFQMGSREAQSGMATDAAEHLGQFLQQCPDHPSAGAAQLLLKSLQNQAQGKTWKIGVLVPVTGKYRNYGIPVVNGVKLALEQANQAGGSKKPTLIVVRDTASDPVKAVQAFEDLTKDDDLDALIGPVGPDEIAVIAPMANQKKITLICPAMIRDGISALGPYLFSNSFTREMEGRAMARYAVEKLGLKRFGILSPDDDYGQTLSDVFTKTVQSMGATVLASQTYVPGVTDFQKQILALGGQNPEASKEGERENNRKMDELKYAIGKEIGKIFINAKNEAVSVDPAVTPAVAFVPLVEALTNTPCPSIAQTVNDTILDSLKAQQDYTLRTPDLVQQALTRLPVEYQGTTLPATADQWNQVAEDLQASIIIAGRILETNPPNDWSDHPTWDYTLFFDAFQMNPKKNVYVRIYQSKVPFSSLKPPSLIRVNSDIQGLYLPSHAAEVPLLASQVHFYDMNPVFLGDHNWENSTFLQEAAKDLEGSYFVSAFYVDSQEATVKKFADDYLRKFSQRPDLLASQAFDAARLLLQATAASNTREDIHNQLLNIRDFDGVSGKTSFAGHGEADKVVPVLKIQNGAFQQVQ